MSAIFVFTTKTTQPRPQVFSVNVALSCKKAVRLSLDPIDRCPFGHPMKFTLRCFPLYLLGLSSAFYRLGLSAAFTDKG